VADSDGTHRGRVSGRVIVGGFLMLSREDIFEKLRSYLEELTEIPMEKIKGESCLYEDLDLDSIDAVDLVVRLQNLTGMKIPPTTFKAVRTVDDVVDCVHSLLAK
jgi:acyl carrier protein